MQFNQDDRLLDFSGKHGGGRYWFPYWFKFIAWFNTLGAIATSSYYLVMYGLTFGLVKCYLWLTAVTVSLIISVTIVQPVKIFVISTVLSAITKSPPTLQLKKIKRELLENPYDEAKALRANRYRLDRTALYTPIPPYKLRNRAENIKYHLEQRKLFAEVLIYFVFVFALFYLVVVHRSWAVFYSTDVAKRLTVLGSYTDTIPFTEVKTYEQFIEYLTETLFPSLFGSAQRDIHTKGRQNAKTGKKVRSRRSASPNLPTWDEESIRVARESYLYSLNESQKSITNIYERSWTMDRSVKMIGKPRMRQLRVRNNTCSVTKYIKPRERMCFAGYTRENEETGRFSLWWNSVENEMLTPAEQRPWIYESAWTSGGVYLIGKVSSYPGGGYILDFAKHIDDCRIIIDYIDAFQWIDARTRAVIIELTLYSVNVNLFSVVHLIAERSATGFFVTSYEIDTAKFMFLASELEAITVCMIVVFVLLIFLFALRQAVRVGRTSLYSYVTKGHPVVDILIIFFGLVSVAFIFLRSYYVSSLFSTLTESQNNEFVSFAYAAIWNSITNYILALLVTFTAIKLFQILRFRVVFLQLQETLRSSSRYFFALSFQLFVVLIAFALFFHLILYSYDYQFSTFGRTLSKLIGQIACLGESCDTSVYDSTSWFLAPLFYIIYLFSILILIVSFFVSVICHSLGHVKNTRIGNKYNALAYLKQFLTANERSDILRLRGGGGTCSRICFGDQEKYRFPPSDMASKVIIMRGRPVFTSHQIYDFHSPYQMSDVYEFEAMKRFVKAELMRSGPERDGERQTAMKAVTARMLIPPGLAKLPEKFYKARDGDKKRVVSTRKLLAMKRIVDQYGERKLFDKYKRAGLELKIVEGDEEDNSRFLSELDKKLTELKVVADEKYREERRRKREGKKSRAGKS